MYVGTITSGVFRNATKPASASVEEDGEGGVRRTGGGRYEGSGGGGGLSTRGGLLTGEENLIGDGRAEGDVLLMGDANDSGEEGEEGVTGRGRGTFGGEDPVGRTNGWDGIGGVGDGYVMGGRKKEAIGGDVISPLGGDEIFRGLLPLEGLGDEDRRSRGAVEGCV